MLYSRFSLVSSVYTPGGEGNGTPHQYSCLENPMDGWAWCAAVHGVAKGRTRLSDFTFTFHFCALEKEMATHSSVLAWRIPGTGEPGGLPSLGSHRVGHNWGDLAAASYTWRRAWQPTLVFLPGESQEQRSMMGYSPWGLKESDTTETEHAHTRGMYMSIPTSQFIHSSPSPLASICLFSTSVSLFLLCRLNHLYHFSRFHMHF